jgi:xanthine dehydrogenase YagS FAD-binding subunit
MMPFDYQRAGTVADAIRLASSSSGAKYLGGGTNLVDLMRETIEEPHTLVDVTGLSKDISVREDGSLLMGAAVTNTALAADRTVRSRFPLLSRAVLAGASGQIRNVATVAGNILQRTRCLYFYDDAAHCNKRHAGAGCDALEGFNRNHAILGTSEACIATHPSDMCVALAALDAIVHLEGASGPRQIKLTDLHRLPGKTPHIETELTPHELITAIEVPACQFASRSTYRKIRDRSSYAFALVSVAAALDVTADGIVRQVRLALGGVAHKPWRAFKAESALQGTSATSNHFREAAEAELADAVPRAGNAFKVELARRAIVACLEEIQTGGRP